MNIKQKIALCSLLVLASAASVLTSSGDTAYALTKSEKKQCYGQWAGRTVGSAGAGSTFDENNFNKNKCSQNKSGSCKIVRYSDGAVIHCQRADGKYDNSSAGFGGTTGGAKKDVNTGDTGVGTDCGGVKTAIIKCSQNNKGDSITNNGIWGLLLMAINILTAGVGFLAIGGIVYASVLYTTAEDKADQVKQAMDIIQNVVIGLIVFVLMWSLLNFLIPGGVFAG